MMDLDPISRAAKLASVGQKPREQLRVSDTGGLLPIVEDCESLPGERDATPSRHERRLPFAFHPHFEPLAGTLGRLDRGPESGVDLGHADAELQRQRLGQGRLHDPLQATKEVAPVRRQLVVFREAPIPLLELRHDGELRVVDEFLAMDRSSTAREGLASLPYSLRGHLQRDLPVETAVLPASFVLLEGADVVAEESRVLRSRMGDQGLRLGQLQPELVVQELADPPLDRLGLLPWPDEPQQAGLTHRVRKLLWD